MVAKVHSGVYSDQVAAGSLSAFVIALTGIEKAVSAGDVEWTLVNGVERFYNTGDTVPDTAADYVARVISTRATIVSMEFVSGQMHVLLENSHGWTASSLQTAIDGLGTRNVSVATTDLANVSVNFTNNVVTQHKIVFETTDNDSTAALGGGEHNQS